MKDLHNPIYIHSLFRSGSTYVFNTFRKNEEEYLCYQEPFHEYIGLSLFDKDKLLKIDEKTSLSLRHQKLDKPYFYEYSLNFEEISNNFNNSLSYKNFFKKDGLDEYIKVLSNVPEKRPVLQMCRSFGRVKFINDVKKGLNIYLWRNPWDQWWSYKITDYFYTTNLLIINAENDSPFLQEIKSLLDVKWFSSDNVEEELGYYHNVKLSSYDNYLLFYSLWCYSFLSCIDLCEIDINIDSLTSSEEYRTNIIQELNKYSISGIDFDDAKSPVGYFSDQDKEFFLKIEKTINSLLKKYYTNSQFERLYKNLSEKNPHLDSIEKEPNLKKEISNIRSLINRYEDRMAEFYSVKDKQLEKHIEDLTSSHTKEIQKLLNLNNDLKIEMGKLIESRDESLLIIKAESKRALDAEITYNNYRAEVNKTLDFHHNVINSLSWRITKPIRDFDRVYLETRHKIKQFYDKKIILNLEEFAIKSLYKRKTKPIFFESFLRKRIRRELLIDITHIYQEDLKTGIQRVVRSIYHNLNQLEENYYKIRPVVLKCEDQNINYYYANFFEDGDKSLSEKPVEPKVGDHFLGLDLNASITQPYKSGLFELWRKKEVKVDFIVYDILPIIFPQWWPENVSEGHEEWLKAAILSSNQILCISNSVKNDVDEYIEKNKIDFKKENVKWWHLGSDIDNSIPHKSLKSMEVFSEEIFEKPTFLMVGTVEPRKGHTLVLEAMELLWDEDLDINLIIVGKNGWLMDEFIEKVNNHKKLNKNLFWPKDVDDDTLKELYDKSTCLIAASEGEGFGLPLIEAAHHGIPIIARDILVFKEVAGDNAFYFPDEKKPEVLSSSIKNWLTLYSKNEYPQSKSMTYLNWRESSKNLYKIIA